MNKQKIGVIGIGVMGSGLAQNLAQVGHPVVAIDISESNLEHANQQIKSNLRLQRMFGAKQQRVDTDEVLSRILFSTNANLLRDASFVIENVTEKWEIKCKVYEKIDTICNDQCVFAANTSAISISRLASVTNRVSKVIGMHFMNPVPMKHVVEMIIGRYTSADTIDAAKSLLAGMGKRYVIVNDSPGFVSNRVLMLTINESIHLLQEKVASIEDVDEIFKECFGHKMGPLETADLIGLDTVLFSLEVLYESFNDPKYKPCSLLREMVSAGHYGRKTGKGFYRY